MKGIVSDPVPSISEFVNLADAFQPRRYCSNPNCKKLEAAKDTHRICTGCKGCSVYCSAECQKADWKEHKKWCADFK